MRIICSYSPEQSTPGRTTHSCSGKDYPRRPQPEEALPGCRGLLPTSHTFQQKKNIIIIKKYIYIHPIYSILQWWKKWIYKQLCSLWNISLPFPSHQVLATKTCPVACIFCAYDLPSQLKSLMYNLVQVSCLIKLNLALSEVALEQFSKGTISSILLHSYSSVLHTFPERPKNHSHVAEK